MKLYTYLSSNSCFRFVLRARSESRTKYSLCWTSAVSSRQKTDWQALGCVPPSFVEQAMSRGRCGSWWRYRTNIDGKLQSSGGA